MVLHGNIKGGTRRTETNGSVLYSLLATGGILCGAYAISWLLILSWSVSETPLGLGLVPYTLPDTAGIVMFMFATLEPALVAIFVTAVIEGRASVGRLLGRIKWWRVGLRWYVVALFGFLLAWTLGCVAVLGADPLTALFENWTQFFTVFLPCTGRNSHTVDW